MFIDRVACLSTANVSGTVIASSRIPMHYWVRESLYRNGLRVGGAIPHGWTGSHFHVGDCEPVLMDFTGPKDHFVATQAGRILVLTPLRDNLTVKDILLPSAGTHVAELSSANAVYRVQNGSVLIVGDAVDTMKLVFYFFDETFRDYRGFDGMLSQSERHMYWIWQRRGGRGALQLEASIAVGESTHRPLPSATGIHPVVKDVLLTLQEEARAAGDELHVRLITKLSGLDGPVEVKKESAAESKKRPQDYGFAAAKRHCGF